MRSSLTGDSPPGGSGWWHIPVTGLEAPMSPLLQANRRVLIAQRLYSAALARLRLGDSAAMYRLSKASYVLGLARERYVQFAKRQPHMSGFR